MRKGVKKIIEKLLDDVTYNSYGLFLCVNKQSTKNERLSALLNFLDSAKIN